MCFCHAGFAGKAGPGHSALLAEQATLLAERDTEIARLNGRLSELQGVQSNSRSSLSSHTRATLSGMRGALTKVLSSFDKQTRQCNNAATAAGVTGVIASTGGFSACVQLIVDAVIPLAEQPPA